MEDDCPGDLNCLECTYFKKFKECGIEELQRRINWMRNNAHIYEKVDYDNEYITLKKRIEKLKWETI
jgi:hypothetical protein